jgi:hypothetical protein
MRGGHGTAEHEPTGRVAVLYVVGWGRSGSTVLDAALGSRPGVFSAGELQGIWESAFVLRVPCSCGAPIPACPLWTEVLERALGPPNRWEAEGRRLAGIQLSRFRERHTRSLLRGLRHPDRVDADVRDFAESSERLYLEVASATGSTIVVDSSKVPTHAAALAMMPRVDAHLVHLVRDPRATAYSWSRPREQPGVGGPLMMPVLRPARSTARWVGRNLLSESVCRSLGLPWTRVRYEDLVEEPAGVVCDIMRLVERRPRVAIPARGIEPPRPEENHMVGGNPVRFHAGRRPIAPDDEWRGRMSVRDRRVATAVAVPLLSRYRYRYCPQGTDR